MRFRHEPVLLDPVASEDTPDGRYYDTPGGRFPSVTTVLSRVLGDGWLREWRDRVGEDKARRVGVKARLRGTAVHLLAERYVRNDPDWSRDAQPAHLYSFETIRPILDARVGTVYGVEVPLWSSTLSTAGRTDLWAEWDGVPSIVDFKTSRRIKTEADVLSYFLQKSCYARMVEERTGRVVPRIVTVMMVDHEDPLVFVKSRSDYDDEVTRVFSADRNWRREES